MRTQGVLKSLLFPCLFLSILPCFFGLAWLSFLLLGVLMAWYTAQFGPQYSLWGLPVVLVACFVLDMTGIALFLCAHVISAVVVGTFIYKRGTLSAMLIVSTLVETAVWVLYTLFLCNQQNIKPADLLFGESMQQILSFLQMQGQQNAEMLENMEALVRVTFAAVRSMLPFLYLSGALLYVYAIFACTRFLLSKQDIQIDTMPYFYELWLPASMSTIFILLFLASFFIASPILANVISFMFLLHVACGAGMLDFYMRRKSIPSGIRALIIAVVLILSSFLGGIGTSFLCFMGMTGNTRRLRR